MDWDLAGIVGVAKAKYHGTSAVSTLRYMLKKDCRWDRTNTSKHISSDMILRTTGLECSSLPILNTIHQTPKAHLLYMCHGKPDTAGYTMQPLLLGGHVWCEQHVLYSRRIRQCLLLWFPLVPVLQSSHCHRPPNISTNLCSPYISGHFHWICLEMAYIGWSSVITGVCPALSCWAAYWVFDHCHLVDTLVEQGEEGTWADYFSSSRLVTFTECSPGHVVHTLSHRALFIVRGQCKNLLHTV